jgi:hypothetical protein
MLIRPNLIGLNRIEMELYADFLKIPFLGDRMLLKSRIRFKKIKKEITFIRVTILKDLEAVV